MCSFMSMIVLKNGDVHICEDTSHETKINQLNLKDDGVNPLFCRVEVIHPAGQDVFFTEFDKWVVKIDQDKPIWWEDCFETTCLKKLKDYYIDYVLVDKTIDEIKDKYIYVVKNCKIDKIINSKVGILRDNSTVGVLWDNSTVGAIKDLATYRKDGKLYVCKNAKIERV